MTVTTGPAGGSGTDSSVLVRSTWHAVAVPGRESPYDVAHYKLYYPAIADGSEESSASGELPPDRSGGREQHGVTRAGMARCGGDGVAGSGPNLTRIR